MIEKGTFFFSPCRRLWPEAFSEGWEFHFILSSIVRHRLLTFMRSLDIPFWIPSVLLPVRPGLDWAGGPSSDRPFKPTGMARLPPGKKEGKPAPSAQRLSISAKPRKWLAGQTSTSDRAANEVFREGKKVRSTRIEAELAAAAAC